MKPDSVAHSVVSIALTAAMACSAGPAQAQVSPQAEPVPPEIVPPLPADSDAAHLTKQKLDQFADAYIAVEAIQSKAAEALRATQDEQQAFELKANAEGAIIEAVERSGLRLEEFNRISQQMARDRELRLRIADHVRERRDL